MKIAIISDIHDNVWNLRTALARLGSCDTMVCCGDLCSPFVIPMLGSGFAGTIHIVFGNNDADLFRITQNASRFPNVVLHGEAFFGEIGGVRVAANHYNTIGPRLADAADLVCYGHNHVYAVETKGTTLIVNPGAIMGFNPGLGHDVPATFMVYDTDRRELQGYRIDTPRGSDTTVDGSTVSPYEPPTSG